MIRKSIYFISSVLLAITIVSCSPKGKKIACVGDSITYGFGLEDNDETAYPVVLEELLGDSVDVKNFGSNATSVATDSDLPYWTTKAFKKVFSYEPDVIVLLMGTNDSKPQNWDSTIFADSYQAIIDTFKTIESAPHIYVCNPLPAFSSKWSISDSIIKSAVIPIIEKVAFDNNLDIIDLYTPFMQDSLLYKDGIHPNEKGMRKLAEIIADKIK